jgi:YegS/Rv2252/BmrU family lipid kinase
MPRAVLIFNPAASRADPDVLRTVSRELGREGWDVDIAGTTRSGDAAEFARQAAADAVDVVAVYGGDGTAMQAVGGLVGHGIPLALIPGGTGNLLAGNLRLPRNPAAAARVIAGGRPRRIDLGRVDRPGGPQYFAVACGTGLDAELMAGTTMDAKRRWGMAAYAATLWNALPHLKSVPHRITVDGVTNEAEAATVLVANCGEIIPRVLRLKKGIALDDGVLDVMVLNARSPLEAVEVLWNLVWGGNGRGGQIWHAQGRCVTVETPNPRPVELDGDAYGTTPFTAEVIAGAVAVLVPAD